MRLIKLSAGDDLYPRPWRDLLIVGTILFFGLQYLFTALLIPLGLLFAFLRAKRLLRWGQIFWARTIFALMGKRVHVRGREHFRAHQKYILITNHASLYDIPAVMAFCPQVSWLGRSYLTRIPLFGYFIRKIDYIAIDPGDREKSRRAIQQSIAKANTITVAIFPEGTRTLNGQIGEFKKGFVHILRATQLDILPVTMNGLFQLKPKNRFIIDPRSRIEVIINPPLRAADLITLTDNEIVQRARLAVCAQYKADVRPLSVNSPEVPTLSG